ncbi:MAG: hypothetical protein ACYSWZ_07610 [Planctomycetota bacterium]|jgi:hypothetical protein
MRCIFGIMELEVCRSAGYGIILEISIGMERAVERLVESGQFSLKEQE